jgi:hypothetical protein
MGASVRPFMVVALVCLVACSDQHAGENAYARLTHPTARPTIPTYPVSAAFGAHAVPLTAKQRAWILRIVHSRAYGPVAGSLVFANVPDPPAPIAVFRIFPGGGESAIIGEPCDHFDPYDGPVLSLPPCASPKALGP